MKVEIFFGSRSAENYGNRIDSIYGDLTTEHAASSYGIPVIVVNGDALGRADVAALAPEGYYAGVRPYKDSDLMEAGDLLEQAGYKDAVTWIGWFC